MACVRCGIVDFDYDMVYQPDGKEYHKELGDCIKCQSERITDLEKRLVVAERNASTAVAVLERLDRAGRL
jgi:hypothetical protein